MKLKLEQLKNHLEGPLRKAYLLSGDEPQQMLEAADAIRAAARLQGFPGRELFSVEYHFDWSDFRESCNAFSLFGEPRVLDLRLTAKPDKEGQEAILHFVERPPEDTLLLISHPKLTAKDQKTPWIQSIEALGVMIQIWPLEEQQLIRWLDRRLNERGLMADQSGLRLLQARVEGNLLAAAQDIEKLYILFGPGQLSDEKIRQSVADSARYDVFDLTEEILKGRFPRMQRILLGLRAEGMAAPVVLWALTREIRFLNTLITAMKHGANFDTLASQHRLWDRRKTLVAGAIKRLTPTIIRSALLLAGEADRKTKGIEPGDPWEVLLSLCFSLSDAATGSRQNPMTPVLDREHPR